MVRAARLARMGITLRGPILTVLRRYTLAVAAVLQGHRLAAAEPAIQTSGIHRLAAQERTELPALAAVVVLVLAERRAMPLELQHPQEPEARE